MFFKKGEDPGHEVIFRDHLDDRSRGPRWRRARVGLEWPVDAGSICPALAAVGASTWSNIPDNEDRLVLLCGVGRLGRRG